MNDVTPAQALSKGSSATVTSPGHATGKKHGAEGRQIRSKGINLIRDTGGVVRIRELHRKVYTLCSVVMTISLLVGGAGYGYWLYQSNRVAGLQERIVQEERSLEGLVNVYNLVSVYKQRLDGIRQVGFDAPVVPLLVVRDLDELALKTNSEMVMLTVDPKSLRTTMQQEELGDLDYLLELLEFKEVTSVWTNILVENILRESTEFSTLIFSGNLSKNYGRTE